MQRLHTISLSRSELYFFGAVFLLFPILVDVEYNLYERTGTLPSRVDILERVIYGVLRHFIPYLVYYRFILPCLIGKRYGTFLGRLVLYFIGLNGYIQYVVYGGLMHLTFLPTSIAAHARTWFEARTAVHFSIVYVLRELLMVTALGYYRQSGQQEKQLYELRQQQLQSELDGLKEQLRPHFFFNTLNNIYSLALQQSPKTAPLVARHADIMRYMLYQARQQTVRLEQEATFLANYVAVESVRFSEKLNIQFETQGIQASAFIEPLLLLPFVENTFKHGIREETSTGHVHILLVLIERELFLETSNSKVSPVGNLEENRGIGLKNALKRLSLLYPEQHDLRVQEDEMSYKLQLRLTLRFNE
ncbi:sensor histidine kinase [Larkinella sp. VNQ87]|uniref:sensor histidine kinase n=1 Tax=Larkinella sp. VNQ87 TaxID=3400921 RepID=UPI003C0545A4